MSRRWTHLLAVAFLGMLVFATGAAAQNGDPIGGRSGHVLGSPADADGDGIPNCSDPDYTAPRDGTGRQLGRHAAIGGGMRFQLMRTGMGSGWMLHAFRYGPGDGTGNDGVRPLDGTGYGPGPMARRGR